MEIIVCNKKNELEMFNYIRDKRLNYDGAAFRKIYVVADDRDGIVEVIDNLLGAAKHHKFTFDEYMRWHEDLVMHAAQDLFPEGESK